MPNELVGISQRLRRQHSVIPDHHSVFQTASLNQTILDEILYLLKKTNVRACARSCSQVFGETSTL